LGLFIETLCQTARLQVMTDRGLELRCGRLLDDWFRRLGLLDVGVHQTSIVSVIWRASSTTTPS
jgi:hypothetical protein